MKVSRDRNHGDVVKALERTGARVFDSSHVGGGFPDLVVWAPRLRRLRLIEIKDGDKKRDNLTAPQRKFHRKFAGTDVIIVTNTTEALQAIGLDVGQRALPLSHTARDQGT